MKKLIGKKLAFQCARYIYYGKVKDMTQDYIELDEAQVIFETGKFKNSKADDAQDLPKNKLYVMRQAVESIYPTRW